MKTAIKTSILHGIIIPALAFLAYGILCWLSDPLGAVRADICVMIPLAVLALAVVRRIRPIEQKSMSKKHAAAMTAAFVLVVCAPAQLMVHAQASIESASGWLYIAKSLVTAPILEEVTYRGIIFGLSRRVLGFWAATAVSATIFQMAHIEPELAIITIPLGIATAGVYELTGRIRYGILLHSIFNLIAIFFVDIHIPRLIALPLYAVSMILLVIAVSKRDALARILRVQAGSCVLYGIWPVREARDCLEYAVRRHYGQAVSRDRTVGKWNCNKKSVTCNGFKKQTVTHGTADAVR